jgi:hypothetical protein
VRRLTQRTQLWSSFLAMLACTLPANAFMGIIYVQAGHPGLQEGTLTDPYVSITQAINSPASSGDVIYIASGNYTSAIEAFPLLVPDGVILEGATSVIANYPRIGGDLVDGSEITGVEPNAIIHINCTSGDLDDIGIKKLRFLGEDETTNSPVALFIEVRAEKQLSGFVFEDNFCERPHQNGTGASGWSTIRIDVENGGMVNCVLADNHIEVSDRGGIEILAKAEDGKSAATGIAVQGNYITNSADDPAVFGFRWHGLDGEAPDEMSFSMEGFDVFDGNVIRSRDYAITYGMQILCEERSDFTHMTSFKANIIEGCADSGLHLRGDGWTNATNHPEIAIINFVRNKIVDNGGSGIVLEWDSDESHDGAGYLHLVASQCNLIADNGEHGVAWIGLGEDSTGSFGSINDTIANNIGAAHGYTIADDSDAILPTHKNCIVYGNGGTVQTSGLGVTVRGFLLANVTYSNWEGITSGTGNIDADPGFVNAAGGNYHLDNSPLSPCVDVGDTGAVETAEIAFDIDRDDRVMEGDCLADPEVDMGCDELDGSCE